MKSPDDCREYRPRHQDLAEDLCILSDAIAISDADLFNRDGATVLIDQGVVVQVNPARLREIIAKHIRIKMVVDRDGVLEVTFVPYVLAAEDKTLRTLLMTERIEDGNLAQRLPKMPGKEMKLTENQLQQVRDRLKIGEPPEKIAPSYNVDVATIRRLAG
jgi:hypothetical protein